MAIWKNKKILAPFIIIFLLDFTDFDTNIHYWACNVFNRQCAEYKWDLPFWEVIVSFGTIIAAYYAARNIRLVAEIEESKYMPVLKIGEGEINYLGTEVKIPVINIGEGVALKVSLYMIGVNEKVIIDGMFDIGSGDKIIFGVGDDKKELGLVGLISNNNLEKISLLLEYEDILGSKFKSELPVGKLQFVSENKIIVPRSGWRFLKKQK